MIKIESVSLAKYDYNCKPHQAISCTVLPLAMHKWLDERNDEGLREWCQPKVWVSAREVLGKVLWATHIVMY